MAVLVAVFSVTPPADGTSTQVWEVGTYEGFAEGTFEGTQVDSTGELTIGLSTLRAEVPQTASVWSSTTLGTDVYLGTGNEGGLWLLRGDSLLDLVKTDAVVLTALATDNEGNLYAGTLPGGSILRFGASTLAQMAKDAQAGAPKVKWEPGKVLEADKEKGKTKSKEKDKEKDEADTKKQDLGSTKVEGKAGEKKQDAGDTKADAGKDSGDAKDAEKPKGPGHWVSLPDAEHVWALAFDAKKKTLYAGTGPEGIVYAVDPSGHATVLADTDEQHIMSLALMSDGAILAGTANGARVLRIEGPGKVETVWDFDGTEIKALALVPVKGNDQPAIVAAVNSFKTPPSFSVPMPSKKDLTEPDRAGQSSAIRIPEGSGLVAAILPDGGYRKLLEEKKTHLAAMHAVEGGVQVATGAGGRVLEVDLEGRNAVILDVGERQVLTFETGATAGVLGTADPAAVHRVLSVPPSDPYYFSKVFDAGFIARWGRFVLRGEGPFNWQTRSGNTADPDDTWSDWSKSVTTDQGQVTSPNARFLQFRLEVSKDARVWNAQTFYLPLNQQATVTEIDVGSDPKTGKGNPVKSKDAKAGNRAEVKITWKVENADGDELSFGLWFAQEGTAQWIPMLDEGEILTKPEFTWDTTSVPAGYYTIKVEASDEGVNDPALALSHELVSRAFLVDNDPPAVSLEVKVKKGSAIMQGKVTDGFSEISLIEYSVDGGPFATLFCKDLIFDEIEEQFEHTHDGLEAGAHTVTVRAYDRRGNGTSAGALFTIK